MTLVETRVLSSTIAKQDYYEWCLFIAHFWLPEVEICCEYLVSAPGSSPLVQRDQCLAEETPTIPSRSQRVEKPFLKK
jgi:hypothetical protein